VAYSFLVSSLSKTLRLFALNHEKEGQAAPASAAAETGKQADILLIPILHPTCFLISRRDAEKSFFVLLSVSAPLRDNILSFFDRGGNNKFTSDLVPYP